jgi:hypothetical protein
VHLGISSPISSFLKSNCFLSTFDAEFALLNSERSAWISTPVRVSESHTDRTCKRVPLLYNVLAHKFMSLHCPTWAIHIGVLYAHSAGVVSANWFQVELTLYRLVKCSIYRSHQQRRHNLFTNWMLPAFLKCYTFGDPISTWDCFRS